MIPWEEIDRATVPGQKNELILRRRGEEFSIRTGGTELMNSRMHGSEEGLANLAFEHMGQKKVGRGSGLRILVGGLGMGLYPGQDPGAGAFGCKNSGGRTDPGGDRLEPVGLRTPGRNALE
nr:hypothetical protein [uncultured Desulfobacter sp.]